MDSAPQNIGNKNKNLIQQWLNFPQRRRAEKEPVGQTRTLVSGQKVEGGLEHLKVGNFCSVTH